ncbi:hypothetical protein [Nonomuraea sp. NPDC049784]|uniref:hypothetical protein n=1 Tax=Nonomuraea sp. NPDC049784 TaxID=3154361 RepID=UPI0033DB42AC
MSTEKEIVGLLARITETWNSGDSEGYAGLFTEDADDVALVIVGGTSSVNGEPDPSRESPITLTALRTPEGWRFASFHNTRVRKP